MVLGLIVFAVLLIFVPWWAALAAGLVVYALRTLTKTRREHRRAVRAAERARRREIDRLARKQAIRERTGIDVDLVGRAAQDVGRAAQEAVRSVGTRVNRRLEARYPDAVAPEPRRDDWLDLDADLGSLRSKSQTEEALRLNDELSRVRRNP